MTAIRLPITAKDWQTQAACAGDWDIFDKEDGDSRELAKSICAGCPVLALCKADYIATPDKYVVAGETTPQERTAATRKANRGGYNHGTTSGYYKHKREGDKACQPCREANGAARRERERETDRLRDRSGRIKGVQAPCADCGNMCGATYCRRCTQMRNMSNSGQVIRGNKRREQAAELLASGMDRHQIAAQLGVSLYTTYKYLAVRKAS